MPTLWGSICSSAFPVTLSAVIRKAPGTDKIDECDGFLAQLSPDGISHFSRRMYNLEERSAIWEGKTSEIPYYFPVSSCNRALFSVPLSDLF